MTLTRRRAPSPHFIVARTGVSSRPASVVMTIDNQPREQSVPAFSSLTSGGCSV